MLKAILPAGHSTLESFLEMQTLPPVLKEHPFSPHSRSGLQSPTSPWIFGWFSATQSPDMLLPAGNTQPSPPHVAGCHPTFRSQFQCYLPVQRRLASSLDLGDPFITDCPLPSEHLSESVQLGQYLDSFLCPSTAPKEPLRTSWWKYWHTDLRPITLPLVDGVQERRMVANFLGLQVTSPPSSPSNVLESRSLIFMVFPISKHRVMLQINA